MDSVLRDSRTRVGSVLRGDIRRHTGDSGGVSSVGVRGVASEHYALRVGCGDGDGYRDGGGAGYDA